MVRTRANSRRTGTATGCRSDNAPFVAGPAITGEILPTVTVLGSNQPEVERARDALRMS